MENYEEIKFLGKGGFGAAYLVKDKRDQKKCVVKMVDLNMATIEERMAAVQEVLVLKTISHPNIVSYQDSFIDQSATLHIVMEYCEGGDLQQKMEAQKRAPFPEDQIWTWFVECCQGIKYLHGRKIIHRDLKPANIFLTKDNSIRLGDFGLAVVLNCSSAYMRTQAGTIAYLPPEMIQDEPYSHKVDIWSLGIVLYQLSQREHPFIKSNIGAVLKAIESAAYAPLKGYSKELSDLTDRLLQKNPRDRPSITEILEIPAVKKRASPEQRLRNVYKFHINDEGQLCDADGNRFQYDIYDSKADNTLRYEGIALALEEYLYSQMECMGLQRLPVPKGFLVNPDYDNPGTFIFASENWDTCTHLVLFIHGSGLVKAGQWTRKLMINNSIDEGTQLPYIRKAISSGYGVVVLNTNDNKPNVAGCQDPVQHGLYVWKNYIQQAEATHIAVKAHSAGGYVTRAIMAKFPEDFKRRVYANAFTGVNGASYSESVVQYAKKVTRNWVTSDTPIGTKLVVEGCDCECVSAGTEVHEETPYKAFQQVMQFIKQRFRDNSPGSL